MNIEEPKTENLEPDLIIQTKKRTKYEIEKIIPTMKNDRCLW